MLISPIGPSFSQSQHIDLLFFSFSFLTCYIDIKLDYVPNALNSNLIKKKNKYDRSCLKLKGKKKIKQIFPIDFGRKQHSCMVCMHGITRTITEKSHSWIYLLLRLGT